MSDFRFEAWPTEFRSITQPFGVNAAYYSRFRLPGHEGIDFMAPTGSKIFAVAPGRVTLVHTNPDPRVHAYGVHVVVLHPDNYETTYAHLLEARVRVGETVVAGQMVGLGDDTGNSMGAHLHLTLRKIGGGQPGWPNNIIDPTPFVLPLLGWREPTGPFTDGWAYTTAITVFGNLAQVNAGGISLRAAPSTAADRIAIVPEGTMMLVSGSGSSGYTPVKVPSAAIGIAPPRPAPRPAPDLPPTVATVDGWGFANSLTVVGNQAIAGELGINLRTQPDRNATNIGLVRGNSTVSVLGAVRGEYLPVRVSRADFLGPVNLPESAPAVPPGPVVGPPDNTYLGWAWTQYLTVSGNQAIVGQLGINLRNKPDQSAEKVGLVKGFATVTIVGLPRGEYTPVLARQEDVLDVASPLPAVEQPTPLPDEAPRLTLPPAPVHDTTPGWAFTAQIAVSGDTAVAGQHGINLRAEPRRDAANLGLVPAHASMNVIGPARGEYTPVRVDDAILQPPFDTVPAPPATPGVTPTPAPVADPDPPIVGHAGLGLHASADPAISDAEHREFGTMRPGIIKVLSFHSPQDIKRLADAHPNATWIVRAFLHFGGRNIGPDQFLNDTLSDVRRSLDQLRGKDVVVELHNEPNLTAEGLGSTWADGGRFGAWFSEALAKYRRALPGVRFIYPGLSPGPAVPNVRQEHIQFIEASRAAVEAADGLGVHVYWSNTYPMRTALGVLDDYINRFRAKPVWVTEASNNKGGVSPAQKGREYLQFWQELQKRPVVEGVTYFVASASNPEFAEEVWVGRGIAEVVGQR